MRKILVDIPERKYVPTLGKGPHYNVYIRKDIVNCLRSYGFIVQVKEEGKKKLTIDVPTQPKVEAEHIEEVKETPVVVEQPVVKEVAENLETTTVTVDKAGSYETTTGRTIEISEDEYALLTKEGVTKQELKDLLEANGFRILYKDTLADLFAKFKIEYQK